MVQIVYLVFTCLVGERRSVRIAGDRATATGSHSSRSCQIDERLKDITKDRTRFYQDFLEIDSQLRSTQDHKDKGKDSGRISDYGLNTVALRR